MKHSAREIWQAHCTPVRNQKVIRKKRDALLEKARLADLGTRLNGWLTALVSANPLHHDGVPPGGVAERHYAGDDGPGQRCAHDCASLLTGRAGDQDALRLVLLNAKNPDLAKLFRYPPLS